jgi:hypothetical protein
MDRNTAERNGKFPNSEERLLTQLLVHAERGEWLQIRDLLRRREVRLLVNVAILASTDEWERMHHLLRLHERALIVKYEGPDRLAVAQLGLSQRTVNALEEVEILTAADLIRFSPWQLRGKVELCGDATIAEIVDALAAFDLRLAGEPQGSLPDDSLIAQPVAQGRRKSVVKHGERRAVLMDLIATGRRLRRSEMADAARISDKHVDVYIQGFMTAGLLERVGHGAYQKPAAVGNGSS